MPKIVDVAAGSRHALALTSDGRVFAWGNGQVGQLGHGNLPIVNFKTRPPDINYFVPYPLQVAGLVDVVAISAGPEFSVALLKDGTIRAWGENTHGQLGDGTTETRTRAVTVRGITNAVAIGAGSLDFAVALLSDGAVMTWGKGDTALGRPGSAGSPIPRLVPGVTGATAIAVGGAHVLALGSSGRIVSWGIVNVYDPVGHVPGGTPAPVPMITTARAIFAGPLSSQALLADGTFMGWGALPSLMFRVDGGGEGARFPVPIVVNGL
jgi:alpha-tubulin suppressor-like RCC1 family protein